MNFLKRNKIYLLAALYCATLWSWLLLIDVGRLANQPFVGKLTVGGVFVIIVGLSAYIFTKSIKYLQKRYHKTSAIKWLVQACFVWALTEAVVAWLVAFIWIGSNGSVDNILPFASATPFLAATPLRFLTRFVGFYGLSAIVLVGIAAVFLKKTRKYAAVYWAGVIVITMLAWWSYKTPNGEVLPAIITAENLGSPQKVPAQSSKLVLLPEYGLDDLDSQTVSSRFSGDNKDYYYIGSKQSYVRTGHSNELIFGSHERGFIEQQPKNRLIPGGEHLSFWVEGLIRTFSSTTYSDFQVRRAVVKGQNDISPFKIDEQTVIGAAVCSSIIVPRDYRNYAQKGATVLTNSASLEIFQGSRLFRLQHRGLAKFIATANARPFLQSSNNWQAFAINSNGDTVEVLEPSSARQVQVTTNSRRTPYTVIGEWMPLSGAALLSYQLHNTWHSKRSKRRNEK